MTSSKGAGVFGLVPAIPNDKFNKSIIKETSKVLGSGNFT